MSLFSVLSRLTVEGRAVHEVARRERGHLEWQLHERRSRVSAEREPLPIHEVKTELCHESEVPPDEDDDQDAREDARREARSRSRMTNPDRETEREDRRQGDETALAE